MTKKNKSAIQRRLIPTYIFLIIVSFISVFPLYWMISAATNTSTDVSRGRIIPGSHFMENFRNLTSQQPLWRALGNSFFYAILTTVICLQMCIRDSLCPFGLIQDLLNKIPFPKKIRTFKGDKLLRKLKYVIFAVFVILLPLFLVDIMGQGAPYFCKLICPAGTLEGGLPLVLLNKSMRSALGWLYIWKNVILVITIILSILIYRPFCKYICPLGALYSVFNPVSLYKYRVDKDKCIKCGKCAKACQMIVDPVENSNSPECIRCGRCRKVCPTDAIQCGIRRKPQS